MAGKPRKRKIQLTLNGKVAGNRALRGAIAQRRADGVFRACNFALSANIKSCMKRYAKVLCAILTVMICTIGFAADQPACKKSGKNCPMNNGGACNCGKSCDC